MIFDFNYVKNYYFGKSEYLLQAVYMIIYSFLSRLRLCLMWEIGNIMAVVLNFKAQEGEYKNYL